MNKKKFNPKDWITDKPPQFSNSLPPLQSLPSQASSIEEITQRIETTATDIAPTYPDWRDLGFALADALGETGRLYYHRLSRFYPNYTEKETNKQFTACLKAHGHGITIKTLYHLAKQAGIKISKSPFWRFGDLEKSEEQETELLPTLPENIFPLLPDFLKQIITHANSREEADLLLLGSIVVISACLSNVWGIYGGVTVFPNLFLFVSAQASAGKGRLSLCRRLVEPIHRQLRVKNKLEQEEYKRQQMEYAANKKNPDAEQPQEPPLRVLFIPANSSATAIFQILNDNAGVGIMFETEGDTLAQTFKSEHGNYSDGFRKAFHHEKISYLRRKDREYVTLEVPKLSALLSGTPRQVQSLIPDAENGLFSRFIFYCMNVHLQWIDVFAQNDESLDIRFDRLGEQFFDFYQLFSQIENIRFSLSQQQQTTFNQYFEQAQQQYCELLGSDYIGTIRRLGLITFRIATVLTVLRTMETGHISTHEIHKSHIANPTSQISYLKSHISNPNSQYALLCSDIDFQISMEILKVLVQHSAYVFRQLPVATHTKTVNPKFVLFQALPDQFDRAKYIEIATQLQIPESTAEKQITRYINAGLLIRQTHGNYKKTEN
jgi:hypothetical protein